MLETLLALYSWIGLEKLTILVLVILIIPSLKVVGPTQVGLVMKRLSFRKLSEDNPVGFRGRLVTRQICSCPAFVSSYGFSTG